jgi:hypothetical protein
MQRTKQAQVHFCSGAHLPVPTGGRSTRLDDMFASERRRLGRPRGNSYQRDRKKPLRTDAKDWLSKSGQLLGGISCHYPGLGANTQQLLAQHEGAIIDINFLRSAPKDHHIPAHLIRFLDSLSVSFRVSRQAQTMARDMISVAAVAL